MKTIQQWTTELTEQGITNYSVQAEKGNFGVALQTFTWFETEPESDDVSTLRFRSVTRWRVDKGHYAVYVTGEAGEAVVHIVYEFCGKLAGAASQLRAQTTQEIIDKPEKLMHILRDDA